MNKELLIWCVCCWEKHRILNPFIYRFKKNKRSGAEGGGALQGTCEKCGSKMSRVLPKKYVCMSVDYVIEQLTNKQNA